MKNLAGNEDCDKFITRELTNAKIDIVVVEKGNWEVPHTLIGKIKDWTLRRAWYYWVATTEDEGLPLSVALEMHNKKYPDEMFDDSNYGNYGNTIRVGGHCGCPSPDEYGGKSGFVQSYHIDTQEGLNEFTRVLNKNNGR